MFIWALAMSMQRGKSGSLGKLVVAVGCYAAAIDDNMSRLQRLHIVFDESERLLQKTSLWYMNAHAC